MKLRFKLIISFVVSISIIWWINNVFSIVEIGPAMTLFNNRKDKDIPLISVSGRIIFHSDRPDRGIYILQDGRVEKFIEHGGLAKFSNDGKKLLYFRSGGKLTIKNLVTNTDERVLFFPKGYDPITYDWSPDGKKICFIANTYTDKYPIREKKNLFIMDIETEEIKQVTDFSETGATPFGPRDPRWSSDGNKILFSAPKKYPELKPPISIFIVNEDGTGLYEVFGDKHWGGGDASWSSDGKKIIFVSHLAGEKYDDIFIVNIDGTGLTRLTNDPWQDRNPVFSPDGKKICYVSLRHGHILFGSELFVINIDGTGQARLTSPFKRKDPSPFRKWATDDYPQWSE